MARRGSRDSLSGWVRLELPEHGYVVMLYMMWFSPNGNLDKFRLLQPRFAVDRFAGVGLSAKQDIRIWASSQGQVFQVQTSVSKGFGV